MAKEKLNDHMILRVALVAEMVRVDEIIKIYESLDPGSQGAVVAMRSDLNGARRALIRRDLSAMTRACRELKGWVV